MVLVTNSCTMLWASTHSSSGTLSDLISYLFAFSLYNHKGFKSQLNALVLYPTFFNLSLNFAIRSSWSEPQLASGLVFADCIQIAPKYCILRSQKMTEWSHSFPRQTIQNHSNPCLRPNHSFEEPEVERFYDDLQDLLELTPKKDGLFLIGDWNAKVESQEIPGVTDKFGLEVQNETGQRLTEFCQESTLVIANTNFQQHKRWDWDYIQVLHFKGFPGSSDSKESACSAGLIPGSRKSPGEGNGSPHQYPCLENPMDRGAWKATVHGVAKSRTWLSNVPFFHWILDSFVCLRATSYWKIQT